ncbi:MAG: SsrA-binding protein SmpB, partial [Flavobacteriaceae bacterium]|nr:SsrA-binding protein SmpB [Flavobacteriaceae bacterium]
MALQKTVKIKNRKARFEYEIISKYTAGIVLQGTEIKAIREGKASIAESFCEFSNNELFVINMTIQEYSHGASYNHAPKSERKLLLNRSELKKLEKEVKNSGLTIIPLLLFTNEKGFAKVE